MLYICDMNTRTYQHTSKNRKSADPGQTHTKPSGYHREQLTVALESKIPSFARRCAAHMGTQTAHAHLHGIERVERLTLYSLLAEASARC